MNKGTALVAQLQARLDAVHARIAELPLVHVLFVVWEDPLITIGQNTFIADALRWAGAESVIVANQNWPQVSMEEIVRLQPEYILFTANHSESNERPRAEPSAHAAGVEGVEGDSNGAHCESG